MRIELAEVLTLARSSASLELQRRHASDPQVPEEYDSTGVVHMARVVHMKRLWVHGHGMGSSWVVIARVVG